MMRVHDIVLETDLIGVQGAVKQTILVFIVTPYKSYT